MCYIQRVVAAGWLSLMEDLMFEFVNDPLFEGLPAVGDGHAAVAVRTACGRAARWVPGGDVIALAQFLGESFVVVGDGLYQRGATGTLVPQDLGRALLVFVPPAGEPQMFVPEGFTSNYAQVVGVPSVGHAETIEALVKQVAALEADLAEERSGPHKPAAVKKAAASTKGKSDGDKPGS